MEEDELMIFGQNIYRCDVKWQVACKVEGGGTLYLKKKVIYTTIWVNKFISPNKNVRSK